MPTLKEYFNRRLTRRETVIIIVILAALAGVGYASWQFIAEKILEARVNAAMPTVLEAIRAQRAQLVAAIEAYKVQFGAYPPDHVLSRQPLLVDPVNNTLLYELVGAVYNPTNKTFRVDNLEVAEADYVRKFFQVDGFKNCAETKAGIKRFLTMDPVPERQLHDDPDVFAVGFQVPYESLAPEVFWEFNVSSWRYVSSSPTNNPGKFDLWVDLSTRTQKRTIGNWKSAE